MNTTLIILIIVLLSILAVPLSLKRLINKSQTGKADRLPGLDFSDEDESVVILPSRGGYSLVLDEAVPEGAERIVVAMHGFCGSKASRAISLLQTIETGRGNGLVKFDWPAHGKSRAKDSDLSIKNCLNDLDTVVKHLQDKYPGKELIAFATSFGGYITMLYHAKNPGVFTQIILRSPALLFGKLLRESIVDEELKKELEETGAFTTGFDRKIRVSADLIEEAEENRIEDIYQDPENWDLSNVTIIHGDADEMVPYEESVEFAEKQGIDLYTVSGADHRYTGPGQLEEAIAYAAGKIPRSDVEKREDERE